MNNVGWILIGLGIWLVLDGVISIYKYKQQSLPEHAIRVARAGVGILLILLGVMLINPTYFTI